MGPSFQFLFSLHKTQGQDFALWFFGSNLQTLITWVVVTVMFGKYFLELMYQLKKFLGKEY